jgi:homoserine dehydrogenase
MSLRVGIIGGGVVGGGVVELLSSLKSPCISIASVCVRDLTKKRDYTLPAATTLTTSIASIVDDKSIDCVVEVMGGCGVAKDAVLACLLAGKHVVTANKALIAEHMPEIVAAQKKGGGKFAYEAAVCGGIPIIHALQSAYSADSVVKVEGICNGTTNFMLCKMETGADYGEVLAEAQALGFAEADPTADVEGHDVRAKIAILSKLAFGVDVPISAIPTTGISKITSVDFEYAKLLGCTIKLIGCAMRTHTHGEYDGPLSVSVTPKMVPTSHLLGTITAAGNAVSVTSQNMGATRFVGPGAGRYPTANSIVSDVVRIANNTQSKDPFPKKPDESLTLNEDYTSNFYVRVSISDGLGIIKFVGESAERHGVSINSILQNEIVDREHVNFVITTESTKLSQVKAMCDELEGVDWVTKAPFFMPLMSADE